MAAPRRDHEQRLAHRIPTPGLALDQEAANFLGARRAARLARAQRGDAGARQRGDEQPRLGGLARALPAFDGDEAAASQFFFPHNR